MHPDLIPWNSKKEWEQVYEDAYSSDYFRCRRAVEKMQEWVNFMGDSHRPGMELTRAFLYLALKDNQLHPNSDCCLESSDLELMYSAEIMRFLNMTIGGGNKKDSLYSRARDVGLPDWIVNIRHQAAHGHHITPLPVLRRAIKVILSFLQNEYWEQEKAGMKEIEIEDSSELVRDNVSNLLYLYVLLKEQIILGFKKVADIQDPLVKEAVLNINEYSLHKIQMKCASWETSEGEKSTINFKKGGLEISKCIFKLLKLLKQYNQSSQIYNVCCLPIIVETMIADSVEHNGIRREIWNSLLRTLHSSFKLVNVIQILIEKCSSMTGENSYQAGIWLTELCKALFKRFKVESLKQLLFNQISIGKKSSNNIILQTAEFKQFKKMLMKKKLNIPVKSNIEISACLFVRIEEKHKNLKDAIRLKEPIFPENWEVLDLMTSFLLYPTQFTEECIFLLNKLLKNPYNEKRLNALLGLCRIFSGEDVVVKKGRKVYKVSHLSQALSTLPLVSDCSSGSSSDDDDDDDITASSTVK